MIRKFGKFQENLARVYIREILHGLDYLHRNGVAHRDIKGANILVDKAGKCKLAGEFFETNHLLDFGSSKRLTEISSQSEYRTIFGTPNYMAPEVVNQ